MTDDELIADAADTPAKYAAQDKNGEWWLYEMKPYILEERGLWDSDGWQTMAAMGKVPAGHDWRSTLREVAPMTTTPNAPTWPRHPAHKAEAPQCLWRYCTCGENGYCAPCPNRPQPDYDPDDVAFASDPINPSHYRAGKIECIDALEAATVNKRGIEAVCTANAIKYLWRYESKGGLEDVRKARWYLELLENHLSS